MAKTRGVYEHPKGSGIWWCQYFATGKRHRERAGRKSDATKLYQKRKTEILRGDKLPELGRRKVTFGDLIDDALTYAREHNRSVRDYENKGELLRASLGERSAEDLTQDDLSAWITKRGVSPATFNRYRAFISLCFREGMARGKVKTNTARLIRQKREPSGRYRYLTRAEYDRLALEIGKANPEHLDAFMVSINTGMRRGEQFSLTWAQVDFERAEINLNFTKNGDDGTVYMNSVVSQALRRRKEKNKGKRGDLVFPEAGDGRTVDPRYWFRAALAAAAKPTPDGAEGLKIDDYTWHGNRHTFCSWLAIGGTPLKTIQVLARHKMISMTARYAHLCPEHTRAEVERLVIGGASGNVVQFASATRTATDAETVSDKRAKPA